MRARIRKAFTLVEILIVVIILGILAAIVVPQFTNATEDAQGGNIQTQLETLQNQIELFRARENRYPTLAELQANPADAENGWGILIDGDDANGIEGGYIKAAPFNPYNNSSTIAAVADADAATDGWHYDEATGELGATNFDEEEGEMTPGEV